MNGEELCQRCSEKEAVVFTFETPRKTLNLCNNCWRQVSYYRPGCMGRYYAGPVVYSIESKSVLKCVSKEKDLKAALAKRKAAIKLVKHLLQVSKAVQESLLTYFDAYMGSEEETQRVKAQSNQRYEQVTGALEKLISSWKTYDFWKQSPTPLGQIIFNHRKGTLFVFFRQVLLYPSLTFESYLKLKFNHHIDVTECIDLIVRGLTKAEKARLITELDQIIAQETNREDQVALEHSSAFLLERLSHLQNFHIDRSVEDLISEELGQSPETYQEDVSRIISSSWKTASLQLTGCLYEYHRDPFVREKTIVDVEAAARFQCKFFPWHESVLFYCRLMRQHNSSGDFGLCLKLLLTAGYHQGDFKYSLKELYKTAKNYADLEVCFVQEHQEGSNYAQYNLGKIRELYGISE